MIPIFDNYRNMLKEFNIDLSQYDRDKLWIDRLIIRGFDKKGNCRKICRLKVTDNLEYEYKFYGNIPKNEELCNYEELYYLFEKQILAKEKSSLNLIKNTILDFYKNGYVIVLPTSMGKDSKLVEYLVNKCKLNIPIEKVFNNTTLDCADVYKEVKSKPDIKIISPNYKDEKYNSFYKLISTTTTTPSRMSRFCCDIFKEKPTEQYYDNYEKVLFICGMRNDESNTRANYSDFHHNDKLKHDLWLWFLPIRLWTEQELWLYTLHNNISINSKYKKGYTRVGCHCFCPYYNKSTWILDKYWYRQQYDRVHRIIEKDFVSGEKWTRMNCTIAEYHLNWNGGQVRKQPTQEVLDEFMKYKGLTDINLAKQYFDKTCCKTENHKNKIKKVHSKNEVAMNLKLFGRNLDNNKFMCKHCLMKEMNWTKDDWDREVEKFKAQGCELF